MVPCATDCGCARYCSYHCMTTSAPCGTFCRVNWSGQQATGLAHLQGRASSLWRGALSSGTCSSTWRTWIHAGGWGQLRQDHRWQSSCQLRLSRSGQLLQHAERVAWSCAEHGGSIATLQLSPAGTVSLILERWPLGGHVRVPELPTSDQASSTAVFSTDLLQC